MVKHRPTGLQASLLANLSVNRATLWKDFGVMLHFQSLMSINSYIENISKRYALGNATEHTFRGDLQRLIEELVPGVAATNEPKRIECGAPDYVVTRKGIPVGYIEAKDVGVDLAAKNLKEQFDRYRNALD